LRELISQVASSYLNTGMTTYLLKHFASTVVQRLLFEE